MERDKGHDTNRRERRKRGEGMGEGRERERGVAYPRQNNYLPFLYARGTFSPLKTWEGEPPFEVCELPPVERMHIYMSIHVYMHALSVRCARVYAIYTRAFLILSTSITASP